jgi:hypothetical protein
MGSDPMQSRVTEPGPAWAWLSSVVGLALTLPLIWRTWTVIREIREFAPVFHVKSSIRSRSEPVLSPLEIEVQVDRSTWPHLFQR